MKAMRISILAALVVLLASCQEEIWPSNVVKEGIPTSVDFSISVPAAEVIAVTKASVTQVESEIRELMLIMFEESSDRKMVLDLTSYLDAGTLDTEEGKDGSRRVYKLTKPIVEDMYGGPVLSGTYRTYAIANWSGVFSNLADLDQLTEEELKEQIATNPSFAINLSNDSRFPMSSYTEGVIIAPEGNASLKISLKRVVARIEFEFFNESNEENPNFTPTSFSIYNIPSQANVFSKDNNAMPNLNDEYFGRIVDIPLSSKAFEFFMLENIQTAKQSGCDTQQKREQWSKDANNDGVTAPEDKNFTYAPKYGTFIVVKGTYTGKSYFGDVSYTIHLGNFSEQKETANGKDYSNFNVRRNERQQYKVTVKGVSSVYTEVIDGEEKQPGVEGSFAETAKNIFVLDAHYEKVMMNLTGLDAFNLFVDTPKSQDNNENEIVDLAKLSKAELDALNLDYKWIHFIKPTSETEFPVYDIDADSGVKIGDIHDLVADIRAGGETYYSIINDKVLTAAFVDEYFYDDLTLEKFINTDNRTLSLRPALKSSADKNSSLVQNSTIEISQRSIKTTYGNLAGVKPTDSDYIPFGIETWDETGTNSFGSNGSDDLSLTYGWKNTKDLTSGALTTLSDINKAGYLTSVSDNSKSSHVYLSFSGGNGYNVCLLRNRDENGNGTLEDNELKWYLPAVEQYLNIWLSEDQLHEDTQLFDRANLASISSAINKASVYFTSSIPNERLYWAFEGASHGPNYGGSTNNANNNVRCIRNLATPSGLYNTETTELTETQGGNFIVASNISAVRLTTHIGEYGAGHTERSADNLLPPSFEVAKNDLATESWLVTGDGTTCEGNWRGVVSSSTLDIVPQPGFNYYYNGALLDNNYTITESDNSISVTVLRESDNKSKEVTVTFSYSLLGGPSHSNSGAAKNTFVKADLQTNYDLCSGNYSQEEDGSDLGQWRVPNQREFMLILQHGFISPTNRAPYVSSTFLTNGSALNKTEPFGSRGEGVTSNPGYNTGNFLIRCVRDGSYVPGEDDKDEDDPVITPPDEGGELR